MPMPYSHYMLAQKVVDAASLPVSDWAEYTLGAFIPDIRYFTRLPRERYHFPVGRLDDYRDDVTVDFLRGYEVHLLIDEVWEYPEMKEAYRQAFPVFLRKRMSRGLQALALELHCLKLPARPVTLRPIDNRLLQDLEVEPEDMRWAVNSMQRYLEQHDLAAALAMAQETQLFPEERLKTVEQVVQRMRNPVLRIAAEGIVARASTPIVQRVVQRVLDRFKCTE